MRGRHRPGLPGRAALITLSLALLVGLSAPAAAGDASPNDQAAREARGSVRVRVSDPSGAAIAGATVTLVALDNPRVPAAQAGPARPAEPGMPTDPSAPPERSVRATGERGEVQFEYLPPGVYAVQVEAEGFETVALPGFAVASRRVTRDVEMAIARFEDEVFVSQDDVDRYLADAFSSVLTQEQIDDLPDDPDELQKALEDMAGPGAQISVNGFRGGSLPPKSQIRDIRIRFDPYDAEFHEAGFPRVDITTRPGQGDWRTTGTFAFRDESLNARNTFAPALGPEQTRRYGWSLDGPLVRNRTSLALNVGGTSAYDSQTIVAATPSGEVSDLVRQPNDRLNVTARLEHQFSAAQFLKLELQTGGNERRNQGVGDFELPEHAYSTRSTDTRLRIAQTSTVRKTMLNELRAELRWQDRESTSLSDATTLVVLDAFTAGGAQIEGGQASRQLELTDSVDFSLGRRHSMRAGAWLNATTYRSDESRNATGTFTFASLADFRAGRPITFTRRVGDPLVEYSMVQAAWFLQDTFRVTRQLQVGLGVRHELQTKLGDRVNLAPRASFTWSPFRSNRTVLRGGTGIFYDWFGENLYEQTLKVDGLRQTDVVVRQPGYPDAFTTGSLSSRPPSVVRVGDTLVMPITSRASIGVDHQLATWVRLRTNASFERGTHQFRSLNANAPVAGVRPNPSFGNISQIESTAVASEKSLDFGLNLTSMERRVFANVNYRLGWRRNEADDALSLPSDSLDPSADWGPSRQDVRHRVFAMFNAPLPRRFRVSANYRFQSAAPFTITTGFDDNGDTVVNDRPAGVTRNSARGDATQTLDLRVSWGQGFSGRGGRGRGGPEVVVRRPGDEGGDMPGLFGGDTRFEIYVQAYNVFNTVNLQRFTGVLTSPFFGLATSAQPPRRIELGVRIGI
jgi:hypothetical protein